MHIVAPFGFYGSGNIGDEAMLNGFANLLERTGTQARVSVGSRNPAHTARVEPAFRYFRTTSHDPRRWWAKLRASAHAIVGGTPIMDVLGDWPLCELVPLIRSAHGKRHPISFVGIGTETLRREDSRRKMVEEIVPHVRHWSVRCEKDKQRLLNYNVQPEAITVAADMAWLMDSSSTRFGQERFSRWSLERDRHIIGVDLVNENSLFEQQPHFVMHLASALDEIIERLGARIVFLSNEVRADSCYDQAAAHYVVSRMRNGAATFVAPNEYHSPHEMMSIIACCNSTISMRYHFCVFSALQGVPFFAIERSEKVADLCSDLAWPHAVSPGKVVGAALSSAHEHLENSIATIRPELNVRVQQMRERAIRNTAAVDALRE